MPDSIHSAPANMRTFKTVEALVDFVDAESGDPDHRHRVMWSTLLRLPKVRRLQSLSPFSSEYRNVCLDIYREIAGRAYEPTTGELAPFSGETRSLDQPPPFNFGSSKSLGDYFLAWGGILKTLDVKAGDAVLEYGPGDGHITLALARMGCDAYAVDIEKRYLDGIEFHAAQVNSRVTTRQGLFGDGFGDKRFDRILFFEAFHHAFEHIELLQTLRSLLKPDGFIVFSGEPIVERGETEFVPFPWGPRLDAQSVWCMRKFGWMELGFERTYFVEALMRNGFVVNRWMNPATGLGNCFIARVNPGRLNFGVCEVDVAEGDGGWYPAEGTHRWTSGHALIPLDASKTGRATLTGVNHLSLAKEVVVRCGRYEGRCLATSGRPFEVSVGIGDGPRLEIITDRHVPRELGINEDQRPLGIAVESLIYET